MNNYFKVKMRSLNLYKARFKRRIYHVSNAILYIMHMISSTYETIKCVVFNCGRPQYQVRSDISTKVRLDFIRRIYHVSNVIFVEQWCVLDSTHDTTVSSTFETGLKYNIPGVGCTKAS